MVVDVEAEPDMDTSEPASEADAYTIESLTGFLAAASKSPCPKDLVDKWTAMLEEKRKAKAASKSPSAQMRDIEQKIASLRKKEAKAKQTLADLEEKSKQAQQAVLSQCDELAKTQAAIIHATHLQEDLHLRLATSEASPTAPTPAGPGPAPGLLSMLLGASKSIEASSDFASMPEGHRTTITSLLGQLGAVVDAHKQAQADAAATAEATAAAAAKPVPASAPFAAAAAAAAPATEEPGTGSVTTLAPHHHRIHSLPPPAIARNHLLHASCSWPDGGNPILATPLAIQNAREFTAEQLAFVRSMPMATLEAIRGRGRSRSPRADPDI